MRRKRRVGGKPVREVLFDGTLVHVEGADEDDGGMVGRSHEAGSMTRRGRWTVAKGWKEGRKEERELL